MNSLHRYLSLLSLGFILMLCAFSQAAAQDPNDLAKFENALQQDGFDFSIGAVVPFNLAAQWCNYVPGVEDAGYSNDEPYLQVLVPKSPQQVPLNSAFKLREDEAIILIGLTPPPAKYFSYTPYLQTRVFPDGRDEIFASLGDAVNNATIKTTVSPPFNSPVVLIFTPDQKTDASVRAALQSAGYPEGIINTVVFPASMLNLGYGDAADELKILMRTAIWQDQKAGDRYINDPPLHVFRVTPHTPAPPNPFPAPHLRIRGTGQTEMELMDKLDQLRQGIMAANSGLHATDIMPLPMAYEGYDYIQRRVDPSQKQGYWGDSRDAFYLGVGLPEWSSSYYPIKLRDGEFLMVYGANHVATGKATYMNINVYPSETGKLTIGNLNDHDFPGTASRYLPPGDPAAGLMYAYKISRSCESATNCLQLSVPKGCTRLTLDANTALGTFTRIYLEPATKVGPALPEMLYDRIIKFSPQP